MALAQINVIPIGTPTSSIGDWIADSIKVLQKESVTYEVGSSGTLIEGELPLILKLVEKMHEAAFGRGIQRVYTTVSIDDRRDKDVTLKSKVASIKKRLKTTGRKS